ncbi:hypothetical protein QAD02_010131 [Eretmocerus hayati]|uniref:Uncharacterized protein n=1 Tax=Eretmocerus hayati TaxID=131215 RepID=A0ACC2NBG2_9HYME|nr:hypothetical protein QAD02_010131 [Eretmocerus hayati]
MRCLVALLFVTIAVAVAEQTLVTKEEWEAYKKEHGKMYEGEEDDCRMNLYSHTKKFIAEHNKRFDAKEPGITWTLGINQFTDELPGERNFGIPQDPEKAPKPDSNLSICEKIKKHIMKA